MAIHLLTAISRVVIEGAFEAQAFWQIEAGPATKL